MIDSIRSLQLDLVPYQLENNNGYPTRSHIAALHQYGPTSLHRTSCRPVQNVVQSVLFQKQQLLKRQQNIDGIVDDYRKINEDDSMSHSTLFLKENTIKEYYEDDTDDIASANIESRIGDPTTTTSSTSLFSRSKINSRQAFVNNRLSDSVPVFATRRIVLGAFGSFLTAFISPLGGNAMTINKKTGAAYPDVGEIEGSVPRDWTDAEYPINSASSLSRLDSSNDAIFYSEPRFVEHVDEQAVQIITKYIANTALKPATSENNDNTGGFSVLDLCSSWTSHLPITQSTDNGGSDGLLRRVAGLGMNPIELKANTALTEWIVQDLNSNPVLPYESNTFDVVLLQLSIDYLTKPLEVCQEIGRVLKPNGTVHILFSNRLFLSKAVAIWTGADDIDHAYTVASYLHFCNPQLFQNTIRAIDLSVRDRKNNNIVGDPMYVVTATKKQT
jgi:SAM-dependent methyltransferase